MAQATIASTSRTHTLGDINVLFRSYTSLANTNTDTLATGTNVLGVIPIQVVGSPAVQCTVSANVITYNVSATTPNTTVMILIGPS
jgi:hypothetical protein